MKIPGPEEVDAELLQIYLECFEPTDARELQEGRRWCFGRVTAEMTEFRFCSTYRHSQREIPALFVEVLHDEHRVSMWASCSECHHLLLETG